MRLAWEEGSPAPVMGERLADVLESWRGTPYAEGQRVKGVAAMCFGFVCGVLDELFGLSLPESDVPRDAEMRRRWSAMRAMLRMRRFYMPNVLVRGTRVWPGDVVIVGPDGYAGHAMIIGPDRFAWETTRGGKVWPVAFESFSVRADRLVRIYRMVPA